MASNATTFGQSLTGQAVLERVRFNRYEVIVDGWYHGVFSKRRALRIARNSDLPIVIGS